MMGCRVALFLLFLLLITGCSIETNTETTNDHKDSIPQNDEKIPVSSSPSLSEIAFSKLSEDQQLKIKRATPVQLIELYVQGVNESNPNLTIATLHDQFFAETTSLEEATLSFHGIDIENLEIVEDEEKNNLEDQPDTFHLKITFHVTITSQGAKWAAGPGEHVRFVELIKQNERWKIRGLATSP